MAYEQEPRYEKPFFYIGRSQDEAICPRCWEVERKQVHLVGPHTINRLISFVCPECQRNYETYENGDCTVRVLKS